MKYPLLISMLFASMSATAQEGMHHCTGSPEPLLTVADFNGDGKVSGLDVSIVTRALQDGEYIAFFDRNADMVFDATDRQLTIDDMGQASTLLDQQITSVFWATEKYRDKSAAQADGFREFTQDAAGHGAHYARLPFVFNEFGEMDPSYINRMDGTVEITYPEGLNYDTSGELAAVFYYQGYDVKTLFLAVAQGDQATIDAQLAAGLHMGYLHREHHIPFDAFDGDEDVWHSHIGACWDGLDYIVMQQPNVAHPTFDQHMTPAQCAASISPGSRYVWNPSFNMLHLWIYKLNPCGKFGGLNPHVSMGAAPEPFFQPLEDWAAQMGLPYIEGGHGGH